MQLEDGRSSAPTLLRPILFRTNTSCGCFFREHTDGRTPRGHRWIHKGRKVATIRVVDTLQTMLLAMPPSFSESYGSGIGQVPLCPCAVRRSDARLGGRCSARPCSRALPCRSCWCAGAGHSPPATPLPSVQSPPDVGGWPLDRPTSIPRHLRRPICGPDILVMAYH